MTEEELEKFSRNSEESFEDYKKRLYKIKFETNMPTWDNIAELLNEHQPPWGQHSRKYYTNEAKRMFDDDSLSSADISGYITELKKERYKLTEERVQNNAYIRKLAREDTLKEIAKDYANQMSSKKILDLPEIYYVDTEDRNEGILCISDWHYGIEVDNFFNKYDVNICKERVNKLLKRVIEIGTKENIEKLHVVNLSDLICGRIHLTLRLESREDIISQTMDVAEILAEFLTELSKHFIVEYRDCLDNHSRLEPNKKDSLELETMVRIIPWYLTSRLANNHNVTIIANEYADDIITFESKGHNIVGVHGHKDKLNKVIDNMCAMTRRRNDLVLSGHFHHLSMDESHECLRISNGSLMGVDQYAQDLRLTNKPSQNMIIVSEENVCEVFYRILLD